MEKDRSNQSSSSRSPLGLPRESILRGRKNFDRLFGDPAATTYFGNHIKIRFIVLNDESESCQMGFIVPKKLGKATKRNHVKRLLREAYRLNRQPFTDIISSYSAGFHGVLMAKTIDINFTIAEAEVIELLEKVQSSMHSTFKV